jgi:hypothetical protein
MHSSGVSGPLFPPEVELLARAACRNLDAGSADQVRALLSSRLDWAALQLAARRHGLTPLLFHHLSAVGPERVPRSVLQQLQAEFHANARRNLLLTGELLRLVKHFEAADIPLLPYKGPALAEAAYGNLALRVFCDLDVLVRRRDAARAQELLRSLGYQPQVPLTPTQEAAWLADKANRAFRNADRGAVVELHWAITPRFFACPLDGERLWERAERSLLCGRPIWSLSAEDLVLVLFVHGAWHCWDRLEWLAAVAEFIHRRPGLNWDRIRTGARELGVRRIVGLGLYLTSQLLGVPLPREIGREAQRDPVVRALAASVYRRLAHNGGGVGPWSSGLFHLRARERLRQRIEYCLRRALTPGEGDWQSWQLPAGLGFLYYPWRPLRLLRRHTGGRGPRKG